MTGAAQTVSYCYTQCALGGLLVAEADDQLIAILLGDDESTLVADLRRRFSVATLTVGGASTAKTAAEIVAYVDHPRGNFAPRMPMNARGTELQRLVWTALAQVPAGTTISYSELARRIGKPTAVRAVAGACAANPLAIVVPCHRVLRSDGGISGYRWGIERKRQLIARERELAATG